MFSFLKNHPFAVEAFFETSLVITFAIPKQEMKDLIPECLELDTFKDEWAFIAVAMVQTKGLRPKGFPKILGNDFFLIGYRVFVRFEDKTGRSVRGLYILGSATDKKKMEFFGNIFTHYNYTTTDIDRRTSDGATKISSKTSRFEISFEEPDGESVPLPEGSPFASWQEARKYAGPLPFTFTCDPTNRSMLIIEGVRQNWKPAPVKVIEQSFAFVDDLGLSDVRLANAFMIRNVPYHWKKGRIEKWEG
ncbi:MAG: DUF2071 domain-containing protein [Acidobacteriota bacterium]